MLRIRRHSTRSNDDPGICAEKSTQGWLPRLFQLLLVATALQITPYAEAAPDLPVISEATEGFTATLLNSDKVLIVGGRNAGYWPETNDALADVELFDPNRETWSAGACMNTKRASHSATKLANGKVLVVGGANMSDFDLASAELYDPETDTWKSVANPREKRLFHSGTLLKSGKVLIVGGTNWNLNGRLLANAELYDADNDRWSETGQLQGEYGKHAGASHSATLLRDGKVLVIAAGPREDLVAKAELYDPVSNNWSTAGKFSAESDVYAAALLTDGKVLVVGGSVKDSMIYDPVTNIWAPSGVRSVERLKPSLTVLKNGKVLITGGRHESTKGLVERYDPATNTWSHAGYLGHGHSSHTAVLMGNGKLLLR